MKAHTTSNDFIDELHGIICARRKAFEASRPFIVAISGIPGSGKTTAAKALEQRIPGSVCRYFMERFLVCSLNEAA